MQFTEYYFCEILMTYILDYQNTVHYHTSQPSINRNWNMLRCSPGCSCSAFVVFELWMLRLVHVLTAVCFLRGLLSGVGGRSHSTSLTATPSLSKQCLKCWTGSCSAAVHCFCHYCPQRSTKQILQYCIFVVVVVNLKVFIATFYSCSGHYCMVLRTLPWIVVWKHRLPRHTG